MLGPTLAPRCPWVAWQAGGEPGRQEGCSPCCTEASWALTHSLQGENPWQHCSDGSGLTHGTRTWQGGTTTLLCASTPLLGSSPPVRERPLPPGHVLCCFPPRPAVRTTIPTSLLFHMQMILSMAEPRQNSPERLKCHFSGSDNKIPASPF